ncbi:hypothetical protein [Gimesia sp.]|uniref:hypothetical protein n=1 Tax=Gimesia sp. TaxID=2024833 RepID=UPI0032ECBE68
MQYCRHDLQRHLRGQTSPKQNLLAEEQREFLRPLPQQTFEACRLVQVHAGYGSRRPSLGNRLWLRGLNSTTACF